MSTEGSKVKKKIIEVNMAEMKISKAPDILVTRGLGSCLGITLYDPINKIGTMAHPMLPDINKAKIKSNPARFVNSVIDKMVEEMEKEGCFKTRMVAKLFGGAHMFSFIVKDSILNIGENNIETAILTFKQHGIQVGAQDLKGNTGRTIELDLENGNVRVRTISLGEKEV